MTDPTKSGLRHGKLIKWKDDRGFGFIQPADGSEEVFLHISELKDSTRRPQIGDTIYYRVVTQDGKARACNGFIQGARRKPDLRSADRQSSTGAASSTALGRSSVLEGILLSVIPLIGAVRFAAITGNGLPLILYPIMSLITYVLYSVDKSRAQKGEWRIQESTLHLGELAGGWLGGFIAQRMLRHKNRKKSYQTTFWGIVTAHQMGWLGWLFFGESLGL
ncbi:DUF1294 domain-containing protein [Leptolyngbya ohadii]|uniref:DUF1294 domain-containing protein n=1 Tax=Leptolyngbya ohadii TaxID=1962290 RepID=UPI000B59CB49|nr:cold shock and DUF1294 domain-containing protein [Leptolyngbya ohadii]